MTLREALEHVRKKHGHLKPELLIMEARRNRSAAGKLLHARYFEVVDDAIAAERWRLEMARDDIRRFRVQYREPTEREAARTVRAYHNVPRPDGNVYMTAEEVTSDPFMRQLVLQQMEREWIALKRRYEHFAEFGEMVRRDMDEAA